MAVLFKGGVGNFMPRKIGLMAFHDITSVQAAKRSEGSSDLRTQARRSAAEGSIAMSAFLRSKRMSSELRALD